MLKMDDRSVEIDLFLNVSDGESDIVGWYLGYFKLYVLSWFVIFEVISIYLDICLCSVRSWIICLVDDLCYKSIEKEYI